MNALFHEKVNMLSNKQLKGSYEEDDCIFLLKNISEAVKEEKTMDRESNMKKGVHYSEMLPIEKLPSEAYLSLFFSTLKETSFYVAQLVADLAEKILTNRYKEDSTNQPLVLVSLARAGTPVGVLLKRYLTFKHKVNIPHYSISIIRGKGVDENAMLYIMNKHQTENLVFVDGWTGKGAIGKVLSESLKLFNERYDVELQDELAVLADPAHSANLYGTREDFFLPSSCLNSIVSGLVSRTLERSDVIQDNDFHGAKVYEEWTEQDLSLFFVDAVSSYFPKVERRLLLSEPITHKGWKEIETIQEMFQITDINKIKPSIGETTRVLLRRAPWKILVKDKNDPSIQHILLLAKEKNVPVECYPNMSYACIGLIKEN